MFYYVVIKTKDKVMTLISLLGQEIPLHLIIKLHFSVSPASLLIAKPSTSRLSRSNTSKCCTVCETLALWLPTYARRCAMDHVSSNLWVFETDWVYGSTAKKTFVPQELLEKFLQMFCFFHPLWNLLNKVTLELNSWCFVLVVNLTEVISSYSLFL